MSESNVPPPKPSPRGRHLRRALLASLVVVPRRPDHAFGKRDAGEVEAGLESVLAVEADAMLEPLEALVDRERT